MVDFFRSAMSYLSGGEGESGGGGGNAFVGQIVDLGDGMKLKVKKVIAEGNLVYICTCHWIVTIRRVWVCLCSSGCREWSGLCS